MGNLFFQLFIATISGIVFVQELELNYGVSVSLSVACATLSYFLYLKSYYKRALVFGLLGFFFLSGSSGVRALNNYRGIQDFPFPDSYVDLEGTISGFPSIGSGTSSLILDVKRVFLYRKSRQFSCRLKVKFKGDLRYYFPGQIIRVSAKVFKNRLPSNFGTGFFIKYDFAKEIHYKAYCKSTELIERVKAPPPLFRLFGRWRNRIRKTFEKEFSQKGESHIKALFIALFLGDRGPLATELKDTLVATGILHLAVISGTHVGAVAFILIVSLEYLGIRRRYASIIAIPAILVFVFFTGSGIPVLRGALLFILIVAGAYLCLDIKPLNILGAFGSIMLFTKPNFAYDPGFILTYIITMAIVSGGVSKIEGWKGYFVSYIRISGAATIVAAPLSLFFFGRFSLSGPFYGLVMVPLTSILISVGIVLITIPFGDTIFCSILGYLGKLFLKIPETLGSYEVFLGLSGWQLFGALIFGFTIIRMGNRKNYRLLAIGMVIYLTFFLPSFRTYKTGNLELFFLDVGQGDCSVVVLPEGDAILIDGGGAAFSRLKVGESIVLPFILKKGIKIRWIAVSHYHPDHSKGITELLKFLKPEEVWLSSEASEDKEYIKLISACRRKGVSIRNISRGFCRQFGRVTMECIWPKDFIETKYTFNNASQVLKISYEGKRFLFTGDIESEVETVISNGFKRGIQSDVVKIPHHGSATSSTEAFLDSAGCKIAVISCGYRNSFGFPAPVVIDRLKARGVEVFVTSKVGAVSISANKEGMKVRCSEK